MYCAAQEKSGISEQPRQFLLLMWLAFERKHIVRTGLAFEMFSTLDNKKRQIHPHRRQLFRVCKPDCEVETRPLHLYLQTKTIQYKGVDYAAKKKKKIHSP